MRIQDAVSRRTFMGAVSAALGSLGLAPQGELLVSSLLQGRGQRGQRAGQAGDQGGRRNAEDYEALAKLANNENPYGPSESVTKAMTDAFGGERDQKGCHPCPAIARLPVGYSRHHQSDARSLSRRRIRLRLQSKQSDR